MLSNRIPLKASQASTTDAEVPANSKPTNTQSQSTALGPSTPYLEIRSGKAFELYDGSFVRVSRVVKRTFLFMEPCLLVKGTLYRRTRLLYSTTKRTDPQLESEQAAEAEGICLEKEPPFPNAANEVVLVCDEIEIPVEDISQPAKLVVTNAEFPRFRNTGINGWLTCRWRLRGWEGTDEIDCGGESNSEDEQERASTNRVAQWERITAGRADLFYKVDGAADGKPPI